MKKYIRKLIKEVIVELFDSNDIPDELELIENSENKKTYKFTYNKIDYGISFYKVLNINGMIINDEKIKNILSKSKNIFYINFGTVKNGQISDDVLTNENEPIKILSFIKNIFLNFIKENEVDAITYFAKNNRDNIYKYIYNKFLKNDFYYYTAKEKEFYDRVFIKKELYENN